MAGKAVEILLKAKDLASNVFSKVERSVVNLGLKSGLAKPKIDGFSQANDAAAVSTDKLGSSLGGTVAKITAFLSVTFLLAKVKDLFLGVTSTGSKFETLQTQLDAVTGSAKSGEEAFAWIKDFTKETPLQLDEVSNSFVKLKAFGLDPMDGTMQKLVDQSSKLGGGQEKLNGIVLAVGQAWAKQKLQAEETLQLVERGVPVYDLLSKALGKTAAEIQQMSADGELGRDAIKALIDEMGSSSLGAAAAQMEDASGIVSNLKDQFTEFFAEIADQGVLTYFKSELTSLTQKIKGMAADGSLKALAKDIADFMISAAENTKALISTIIHFSSELKTLAIAMVAVKFGGFLRGLTAVAPAAIAAAGSIKTLSAALIATGWGAVALAIGYVVSKLYELKQIQDGTAASARANAVAQQEVEQIYADLSARLGIQIQSSKDLIKAEQEGLIVFDEKAKRYEKIGAAATQAKDAQDDYTTMLQRFNAEMANNADATQISVHSTEAMRAKIVEMTKDGITLAEALGKMTQEEFAQFNEEAARFGQSGFTQDLEKAEVQIAVFDESVKRLGLDAELLKTGMTSAGKESVAAFAVISESANISANKIDIAFKQALSNISTKTGFDKLIEQIKKLGKEGKLSGLQVADALKQIEDAAKKANKSLHDMLSSVGTAGTVEALNEIALTASTAFDQGKITAQEYLDVMTEVDAKKSDLVAKTQEQIDKEKELAGTVKSGAEEQVAAEKKHHREREKSIQITGRLGEATAKALEISNAARRGTILGTQAIRQYFAGVNMLAARLLEASENADKFSDNVLKTAESGQASEQQMASYVKRLEQMIAGGKNLDNQSLSKLQNALSAAKSKMAALKDETKSAQNEIAGLASELAGLEGDQLKVQAIEAQQRRLDIEEKIAQAQAEGNTDAVLSYNKALSLLDKINAKKKQQIINQQQADTQQNNQQQHASTKQSGSSPSASSTRNNAQSIPSGRTVSISFVDPKGETVTGVFPERDENKMIDIFRKSGAVTR